MITRENSSALSTSHSFGLYIAVLLFISLCSASAYAKAPLSIIAYKVDLQENQQIITSLGELKAFQSSMLSPNVSRAVTQIHFDDGQQVKKGQLLVEFNNRQELAELKEKQVAASEAKKQYLRLKNLQKRSTAVIQSQLDGLYRDWQVLEAEINTLKARIADLKIVAPFAGQLGLKNFSKGSFIKQGEPVISLDNIAQMKLDLLIPSNYLNDLYIGQELTVHDGTELNKAFSAKIIAIAPQLDSHSRMLQVRAILDNTDLFFKSNMLVKTILELAPRQVLAVPNKAILMLGDRTFVYKVHANNPISQEPSTIEKVEIKVGEITDQTTEIISGLKQGDLIVSQGVLKVRPGSKVLIKHLEQTTSNQALLLKPTKKIEN